MKPWLSVIALVAISISTAVSGSGWMGTWMIKYRIGDTGFSDTISIYGSPLAITGTNEYGDPISGSKIGNQVCVAEDINTFYFDLSFGASNAWCFDVKSKKAHNIFTTTDTNGTLESSVAAGTATKGGSTKSMEQKESHSLGSMAHEDRIREKYFTVILKRHTKRTE